MEATKYKISVTSHNKTDDHVEYTITVTNLSENATYTFSERYSNLKVLNDQMKKEVSSAGNFPKFPPKKFFGSSDEKFLNQRQQELNIYFEEISSSAEYSNLPSLKKFLEDNLKKAKPVQVKKKENKKKENDDSIYAKKAQNVIKPLENYNPRDYESPSSEEISKEKSRCKQILEQYKTKLVNYEEFKNTNIEDKEVNSIPQEEFQKIIDEENIFDDEGSMSISKGNDGNFDLVGKNDEFEAALKTLEGKIAAFKKENKEKIDNAYVTKNLIIAI